MRVEGRDFVDFGECQFHLGGERSQMRSGQMAVMILDEMKMLDQQIAPARPVSEQPAHFVECLGVDLSTLGRARRTAAATRAIGPGTGWILDVHCLTSGTI